MIRAPEPAATAGGWLQAAWLPPEWLPAATIGWLPATRTGWLPAGTAGRVGADADPATRALLVVGVGLLALLVVTAALTLGASIRARRADRRRRAFEESIRTGLLDRLGSDDPDWEAWVATLSRTERDVLAGLLERYLELLAGRERTALLALADALDLERRARAAIESGSRRELLEGLRRLALLERSVGPEWLLAHLPEDRAAREAAAAVLSIEAASHRRTAVELLFAGGPPSVFGLDALYRVAESDPEPLLRWLAETSTDDPDLLAGALFVLDQVETVAHDAPLDGVLGCLDHGSPTVRARACLVLGAHGWRPEVRDRVDVESLLADPSPTVRTAAYRMLDGWGDADSRASLKAALAEESDGRARLVLAGAVERTPPGTIVRFFPGETVSEELQTWAGVDAVTRRRRDPLR